MYEPFLKTPTITNLVLPVPLVQDISCLFSYVVFRLLVVVVLVTARHTGICRSCDTPQQHQLVRNPFKPGRHVHFFGASLISLKILFSDKTVKAYLFRDEKHAELQSGK